MNREPKNVGKLSSASASAAAARRLMVERLEMRTVLATMFGLPETTALAGTLQTSDLDLHAVAQLRPTGAFRFFSPGLGPQFEVAPAELGSLVVHGENLPTSIGNAVAFSEIAASLQFSKGWFSLNRPGIVRPIEIREADSPVKGIPWPEAEQIPDATKDDSPVDDSPNESAPAPNDPPTSTTPSQPTSTPKANDWGSDSPRFLSWLEIEETHSIAAGSLRSTSPHADETHHALHSHLTSNLGRNTPASSELEEESDAKEDAKSELAGELLELPASRGLNLNTEGWTSEQRLEGPAQSASRAAAAGSAGAPLFNPLHTTELGAESMLLSVPDDIAVSFDEGGLVELIAAETLRKQGIGAEPRSPGSIRTDSIDAEVGMFQAIDVAASLVDDPASAIMAPFAFVIVFQLFDRRRKVAAAEETIVWSSVHS